MENKLNLKVIIGSTRQGRFSEKVVPWLSKQLAARADFATEILDLRDYPLPFFDQAKTPSMSPEGYDNEVSKQWAAKIAEGDAFIVITPEYNHGYSAVLKNALDWTYVSWNKKPIGFVSYGSALGVRAVEQLRQVVIELQMAPIRAAVHLPREILMAGFGKEGPLDETLFAPLAEPATAFFDQLSWWGHALKAARAS